MFAADCVLLLTGKDFAEFRGEYEDARRAAELLLQVGGVEAIATRKLGDPIPWQMAQRGDVALVDIEGRPTLAICDGAYAVGPGDNGSVYLLMDECARKAWSV